MITIEQIKNKLIELGFEKKESPLYNQLTLDNIETESKYLKKIGDKYLKVEIDDLSYVGNGILKGFKHITLCLQNQEDKTIIKFSCGICF